METGIEAAELSEDALRRELRHLHETRNETFLHGSADALEEHTRRTFELEQEYLRRHPEREVNPRRTREGARNVGQHA
ncbi:MULTISPECIES: DUF6158 family protein [Actinopolyspora]|uniref:Uncharacterized protein n=2 Tax=Actinopolyspora saharensis TaxID=995062 RepID=A0A1H1H4P5_9ACTN|nr:MULTISPECIES: DUF6158 family protein [Actinopolyspora]SDR20420.1 hypothetical protein SAMN04489718_4121 [Actinopolyspora saharensis]